MHAEDASAEPAALFVNLFVSSTLSWADLGLEITQRAAFPTSNASTTLLAFEKVRCQRLSVSTAQQDVRLEWRNGEGVSVAHCGSVSFLTLRLFGTGGRIRL